MTGARVKDCIVKDGITFILHENEMGKAIGKHGANIKRINNVLKKDVKLIEFSSDKIQFIQNLINPIQAKEIKEEDGVITIYGNDTKSRGLLIGRDRHNINSVTNIAKRYFDIQEIKVA